MGNRDCRELSTAGIGNIRGRSCRKEDSNGRRLGHHFFTGTTSTTVREDAVNTSDTRSQGGQFGAVDNLGNVGIGRDEADVEVESFHKWIEAVFGAVKRIDKCQRGCKLLLALCPFARKVTLVEDNLDRLKCARFQRGESQVNRHVLERCDVKVADVDRSSRVYRQDNRS